jgi:hypothetical protein
MVPWLRATGIAVAVDPEDYPDGRFARLYDPEGNPVELWEPRERDASIERGLELNSQNGGMHGRRPECGRAARRGDHRDRHIPIHS